MEAFTVKSLRLLLVLISLISAGCTALQAGSKELPVPSEWKLVSYGGLGSETPVIEGSTITLEFKENGQAGGNGGCNSYGAMYETQDSAITFKDIVSTLMACVDEQVTQQETQYFQALQTASEYKLSADNLTILYDDGQKALNFTSQSSD